MERGEYVGLSQAWGWGWGWGGDHLWEGRRGLRQHLEGTQAGPEARHLVEEKLTYTHGPGVTTAASVAQG